MSELQKEEGGGEGGSVRDFSVCTFRAHQRSTAGNAIGLVVLGSI